MKQNLFFVTATLLLFLNPTILLVAHANEELPILKELKQGKSDLGKLACAKTHEAISRNFADTTVNEWLKSCNDLAFLKRTIMQMKTNIDDLKKSNKNLKNSSNQSCMSPLTTEEKKKTDSSKFSDPAK